jgi:hypothetical protein
LPVRSPEPVPYFFDPREAMMRLTQKSSETILKITEALMSLAGLFAERQFFGLGVGSWAEWFAALGTIAAVVVALWPLLKDRLFRPRLVFAPIDLENDADTFPGPQHFFRFRVMNESKVQARNVQVIVSRAFREEGGGLKRIRGFLPCNLVWTNDVQPVRNLTADIHGGLHRHCDIGAIGRGPEGVDLDARRPIIVQTNIQPTNQFNHLVPGTSCLELQLLADNFEPAVWKLTIDWSGRWHDDIDEMVRTEVKMTLVKGGVAS